jgi:hypothetical protein
VDLEPWRVQLLSLLDVARLGAQFPDAARWRGLLELLGRGGPRGRPLAFARSPVTGLPTRRALAGLHRMQHVAREFLTAHRHRPTPRARAFSLALGAIELPPLQATAVRLVARGKPDRFVLSHERLDATATRFTVQLGQRSGRHVLLGRDDLARPGESLERALRVASGGDARDVYLALAELPGLEVTEVVRGELGPFVSSLWPAPKEPPADVRALRAVIDAQPAGAAVLAVSLERLGGGVAAPSHRDPWAAPLPSFGALHGARERRLFCTPPLEAALKAGPGRSLLVRSR